MRCVQSFAALKHNRVLVSILAVVIASSIVAILVTAASARDDSRDLHQMQIDSGTAWDSDGRPANHADVQSPLRGTIVAQDGPSVGAHRRKTRKVATAARQSKSLIMEANTQTGDARAPTIFEDRTLRRGDAIMTGVGLRLFEGSRTFPYSSQDFSTLAEAKSASTALRKRLLAYDGSPLRQNSIEVSEITIHPKHRNF